MPPETRDTPSEAGVTLPMAAQAMPPSRHAATTRSASDALTDNNKDPDAMVPSGSSRNRVHASRAAREPRLRKHADPWTTEKITRATDHIPGDAAALGLGASLPRENRRALERNTFREQEDVALRRAAGRHEAIFLHFTQHASRDDRPR